MYTLTINKQIPRSKEEIEADKEVRARERYRTGEYFDKIPEFETKLLLQVELTDGEYKAIKKAVLEVKE